MHRSPVSCACQYNRFRLRQHLAALTIGIQSFLGKTFHLFKLLCKWPSQASLYLNVTFGHFLSIPIQFLWYICCCWHYGGVVVIAVVPSIVMIYLKDVKRFTINQFSFNVFFFRLLVVQMILVWMHVLRFIKGVCWRLI